jgi:putative flippase GtrA
MSITLRTPAPAETPARPRPARPLGRIFSRYTIGSVVAAVVSESTLLLMYGLSLLGPRASSVAAWVTGAGVNYVLNRRWAWGRTGRAHPIRELLPYWAIAVVSMLISAWATGVASNVGNRLFETHGPRVVFVGAAFLGVYGVLFIAKFLVFHYVLFADRTEPRRRSRHQVPSTTRQ